MDYYSIKELIIKAKEASHENDLFMSYFWYASALQAYSRGNGTRMTEEIREILEEIGNIGVLIEIEHDLKGAGMRKVENASAKEKLELSRSLPQLAELMHGELAEADNEACAFAFSGLEQQRKNLIRGFYCFFRAQAAVAFGIELLKTTDDDTTGSPEQSKDDKIIILAEVHKKLTATLRGFSHLIVTDLLQPNNVTTAKTTLTVSEKSGTSPSTSGQPLVRVPSLLTAQKQDKEVIPELKPGLEEDEVETHETKFELKARKRFQHLLKKSSCAKHQISWSNLVGVEALKDLVTLSVVAPQTCPEFYTGSQPCSGNLLLFGPPGVGKSVLAKVIAGETGANLMCIKSTDVKSKYFGQSDLNVKALFATARENTPCVVYLDEFEQILATRDTDKASGGLQSAFLSEMDGADASVNNENLIIICATNLPWLIDIALVRRFGSKVYVTLPEKKTRADILKMHIKNNTPPFRSAITDEELEEIATHCKFYSHADLATVIDHARKMKVFMIMKADHFVGINRTTYEQIEIKKDVDSNKEYYLQPCLCAKTHGVPMTVNITEIRSSKQKIIFTELTKGDILESIACNPATTKKDSPSLKLYENFDKEHGTKLVNNGGRDQTDLSIRNVRKTLLEVVGPPMMGGALQWIESFSSSPLFKPNLHELKRKNTCKNTCKEGVEYLQEIEFALSVLDQGMIRLLSFTNKICKDCRERMFEAFNCFSFEYNSDSGVAYSSKLLVNRLVSLYDSEIIPFDSYEYSLKHKIKIVGFALCLLFHLFANCHKCAFLVGLKPAANKSSDMTIPQRLKSFFS